MSTKFAYIDVETSGTDPRKHGITQIAGEIVIDGVIKDDFDLRPRLFPGDEVEQEAMDITNMTEAAIMERPMGPKDAHGALEEILKRYVNPYDKKDKFTFVAYNAKFDWDFMQQFFTKCGDKYFGSLFWWPAICVAMLTMNKLPEGARANMESMRLGYLAEKLGLPVDPEKLHDAGYDIYLTRLLHELVGHKVPKASPKSGFIQR